VSSTQNVSGNAIRIVRFFECGMYCRSFFLTGYQDDQVSGGTDQRWREGNTDGSECWYLVRNDEVIRLMERFRSREEGGDVRVRTHAQ
jgi:hypothetical protein